MLSRLRKTKKDGRARRRKNQLRRRLRAEFLENRRVLAGVVDVIDNFPDNLELDGDDSDNHVQVVGTGVPGQVKVIGVNTLLTLDGSAQVFNELTINGVVDNLHVRLGDGEDTFELGSATTETEIADDVEITNDDDDTNIITNVDIGEDLQVFRDYDGHSHLRIVDSIIRDDVELMNNDNGADGDTKTEIENSEIEGHLHIYNGDGDDTTVIVNTTIGAREFVRPDDGSASPEIPIVDIDNGDGSSLTSITSKNDPDATEFLPPGTLGRPTIFGSVDITNGDPIPGDLLAPPPVNGGATPAELLITVDIVVVNQADILGGLDIENNDGHTETIIVDSAIGIDTKSEIDDDGYGEVVEIDNQDGFDVLLIDSSQLFYGLTVDNNDTGSDGLWGSQTDIRDSDIGGRDGLLDTGTALVFMGDDGDDVFNISDAAGGSTIDGLMTLDLYDGDDSVNLSGLPGTIEIYSLMINGNDGDDSVFLRNTEIESMVMIELHDGVDTFDAREGVVFPSGLAGTAEVEGGDGADFWHSEDMRITLALEEFDVPF